MPKIKTRRAAAKRFTATGSGSSKITDAGWVAAGALPAASKLIFPLLKYPEPLLNNCHEGLFPVLDCIESTYA